MASFNQQGQDEVVWALGHLLAGVSRRLEEVIRAGHYDRVFFLSREGLIMMRAMRAAQPNTSQNAPQSYLLASRRSLGLATCYSVKDCYRLLNTPFHPQPLSQLMLSRFGLPLCPGADSLVSRHQKATIKSVIRRYSAEILAHAAVERKGYLSYLLSKKMNPGGRYLLVDVGYNGTFHRAFQRLMPTAQFDSFCLAAFKGAQDLVRGGKMHLVFDGVRDNQLKNDAVSRNVACLESLLMAPHPSFLSVSFDSNRKFVFLFDGGGIPSVVQHLQNEALAFVPQLVGMPAAVLAGYFETWLGAPSASSVEALSGVFLDDSYGGQQTRSLVAVCESKAPVAFPDAVKIVDGSGWRDGALVMLRQLGVEHKRLEAKPEGSRFVRKMKKIFRSRDAFKNHLRVTLLKATGRYQVPRDASFDVGEIAKRGVMSLGCFCLMSSN